MKQLISIKKNEKGDQIVSARELHEFLCITTKFTMWCDRMFDYGFDEGKDYFPFLVNRSDGLPGKPKQDFALTMDCAKEISMIQRSPKGKQARQYFIDCEKSLKSLGSELLNDKVYIFQKAFDFMEEDRAKEMEWNQQLQREIRESNLKLDKINSFQKMMGGYSKAIEKPVVVAVEDYRRSLKVEPFCATQRIAKQLGDELGFKISVHLFNSILEELGIQQKVEDSSFDIDYHWELTGHYRYKGYQTYYMKHEDSLGFHGWMRWTEKGALWAMEKVAEYLKRKDSNGNPYYLEKFK